MSLKDLKDAASEGGGGGDFVNLKDGDSIEGVFLVSEEDGSPIGPAIRLQWWDQTAQKYVPFDASRHDRPAKSILFNFYDTVNKKVVILNGSRALVIASSETFDEVGTRQVFKVKRTGNKSDTRYFLFGKQPVPEEKYQELLGRGDLFDVVALAEGRSPAQDERNPPPIEGDDSDLPF